MVTTTPFRVVFFGTPEFAVPTLQALLDSPYQVIAVVTQPDRPKGRGQKAQPSPVKQLAISNGLAVLEPDRLRDPRFLDPLRAFSADLGVVAAYGRILPEAVLDIPKHGLINVHASLLPKYRGAAPVHRAVMAGETETGVTIMRVVKALDAGAMISKLTRPIRADETSADVERDLAVLGGRALVTAIKSILEGSAVETPQQESEATYAHKIEKKDGVIDWLRPARDIHNQIRGLHPWPHAFSELGGERIILLRSDVALNTPRRNAEPGTILTAHGDDLTVMTGSGVLRILALQREGRRPMSPREFLSGRRVEPGAVFQPPPLPA
jgi:methionyl-tRNA formyltransferase